MVSNFSSPLGFRKLAPVSVFVCLVSLPFHVGSLKAQQAFQPPTADVLSPPDTVDSMRRLVNQIQNDQQRATTGLPAPTAHADPSTLSLAVSSSKFTNSSLWADNRGTWKLEFPGGQVCSINKLGSEGSAEGCR